MPTGRSPVSPLGDSLQLFDGYPVYSRELTWPVGFQSRTDFMLEFFDIGEDQSGVKAKNGNGRWPGRGVEPDGVVVTGGDFSQRQEIRPKWFYSKEKGRD